MMQKKLFFQMCLSLVASALSCHAYAQAVDGVINQMRSAASEVMTSAATSEGNSASQAADADSSFRLMIVPTPSPVASAAEPEAPRFSYGRFQDSLFFSKDQIQQMKQALDQFESTGAALSDGQEADLAILAPKTYPAYYLSSIVYQGADSWTVWVNGAKITPKANEGELTVVSITPDKAQFAWKPPYFDVVLGNHKNNEFAASDSLAHRLSDQGHVSFDASHEQVLFTLRPNQSFVGGYAQVFEGNIPPVSFVTSSLNNGQEGEGSVVLPDLFQAPNTAAPAASGKLPEEQKLLDDLLKRQQNFERK